MFADCSCTYMKSSAYSATRAVKILISFRLCYRPVTVIDSRPPVPYRYQTNTIPLPYRYHADTISLPYRYLTVILPLPYRYLTVTLPLPYRYLTVTLPLLTITNITYVTIPLPTVTPQNPPLPLPLLTVLHRYK
jgi:hypothetical protein